MGGTAHARCVQSQNCMWSTHTTLHHTIRPLPVHQRCTHLHPAAPHGLLVKGGHPHLHLYIATLHCKLSTNGCSRLLAARGRTHTPLTRLEAILLPFIEKVGLSRTQIYNLGAPVPLHGSTTVRTSVDALLQHPLLCFAWRKQIKFILVCARTRSHAQ